MSSCSEEYLNWLREVFYHEVSSFPGFLGAYSCGGTIFYLYASDSIDARDIREKESELQALADSRA